MKTKNIIIALLVLSLSAVQACREDRPDCPEGEGAKRQISLTIDGFLPENGTKTTCGPEDESSIVWSEGDLVGIFPKEGYQEPFTINADQAGLPSATADEGYWAMRNGLDYCAYYPFDIANFNAEESKTKIPVTYAGQFQTGDTFGVGSFDYACSDWETANEEKIEFTLHHIGALVAVSLRIPKDGTYTGFRLEASESLIPVSGSYDITSENPAFVPETYASSIALELKDFTARAGETKVFHMMLPPCDLSNAALSAVLMLDEGYYLFDISGKKFEAGVRYDIEATLTVLGTKGSAKARFNNGEAVVNWVQLWTGGPRFAVVNLDGCHPWTESMSANDLARVMWGDYWYVPTKDDMTELYLAATEGEGSTKVSARRSGNDFEFRGKTEGYTENTLSLPAMDPQTYSIQAPYWTGTDNLALCLHLTQNPTITTYNGWHTTWGGGVTGGNFVRPVCALLNK